MTDTAPPAPPGRTERLRGLADAAGASIASAARGLPARLDTVADGWRRVTQRLYRLTPKGLYGRSLMIIILPMIIVQSVVAFVFMETHWQTVTRRLSSSVVANVAALIDLQTALPRDADPELLRTVARNRLGLTVDILPPGPLPAPTPQPFFSVLDWALNGEFDAQLAGRPFWIDTVGRSNLLEIRVQLAEQGVMRVFVHRAQAYASNSHIFIAWMVGTTLVLLLVAILFLRNQIRPIQELASAAERFGKGREVGTFRPRGAREVRAAATAFLQMKRRIERSVDQRTAMLNGVSHDLRTVLTRFRLQVHLLGESPETEDLLRDIDEMGRMLEAYLAFARGDSGEASEATDVSAMVRELEADAARLGREASSRYAGPTMVRLRPQAFKRCLANLVANAARYGRRIDISAENADGYLTISIDDDGPGIPEASREEVFRPFYRLDDSRNQDEGGTGLGLAIARDIATSHGGDITLSDGPLGGLRAQVRIPV